MVDLIREPGRSNRMSSDGKTMAYNRSAPHVRNRLKG